MTLEQEKITKTLKLTVNKKIADETQKFNLIYQHEEKFPIKSVVDIPEPPMGQITEFQTQLWNCHRYKLGENPHDKRSGYHQGWQPGVNPYSIPADGSVVKIFKFYQWAWVEMGQPQ